MVEVAAASKSDMVQWLSMLNLHAEISASVHHPRGLEFGREVPTMANTEVQLFELPS
jgi:hypothetical protein